MSQVVTVRGAIDSADLGVCLTHEHVLNDVTSWWHPTSSTGLDPDEYAHKTIAIEDLWDLKHDPFGNIDNCRLDDLELAVEEVARFASLGGHTIIEATGLGLGRSLAGLRRVSERTGVNIIAGTGFYLEAAHPAFVAAKTTEQLAELLLADLRDGEHGIRPGIIGEIGVSGRLHVTFSAGISEWREQSATVWLAEMDERLYAAKSAGRNRIVGPAADTPI